MVEPATPRDDKAFSLLDPRVMDPEQEIVARDHLSADEVEHTVAVLEAMKRWRDTERAMSEASQRYMRLGDTDMRALRYLIAAQRQGVLATPTCVAANIGISAAAATKLVDRLVAGGHLERHPHPDDRRRIVLHVTEETRAAARASVGRTHARRFDAVAALTPEDRAAVLRFYAGLVESAEWVDGDS